MSQRIVNVLNYLIEVGIFFNGYHELSDNLFELKTRGPGQAWLRWEVSCEDGDERQTLVIEISWLFGYLNDELGPLEAARNLLTMLGANDFASNGGPGYYGVRRINDTTFVTANSTHFYLTKWHDKEIAEALVGHFVNLYGPLGIGFGLPKLPILKMLK